MHREEENFTVTKLATFADKNVEARYFRQEIFSSLPFVRRIVLICGVLFFAVSLYDIFYYQFDPSHYLHSVASRAVGLALSIAFYVYAPKMASARNITVFLTVFEFSIILGYIYILYSQRAQGFASQATTIMLMILTMFMFPNRWVNLLLTSISTVAIFLLLAPRYVDGLTTSQITETAIVLGAAIILATAYFYRENHAKRKQYAESRLRTLQSYTDNLTGIYNRAKFDEELAEWCKTTRGKSVTFSVLLFDIDHFKRINDTFGHLVGDQVLADTASLIAGCIRTNDIFARWGGEEFVILFPNTDAQTAGELAERLRQRMAANTFGEAGHVTISLGVVSFAVGDTPITIMQRVDKAMYRSKQNGRNMVSLL